MISVRIKETGKVLDTTGNITFTFQQSDIGDVTAINSSYSWIIRFPKTPTNNDIFKLLGIAGSDSLVPYKKTVCEILENGVMIEPNGNLIITEVTDKEYKGHVKAGIIDFLQALANDNISDVIDLSPLTHLNTPLNIIDSFTAGLPYKYIVAYYNGQLLADEAGISNLNPFALVPSIDVKYLWDKIFQKYGWTYSGIDLTGLWMTYPNAIGYDTQGAIEVLDGNYTPKYKLVQGIPFNMPIVAEPIAINGIDNNFFEAHPSESGVFVCKQTGNYNIKAKFCATKYFVLSGVAHDVGKAAWRVIVSSQTVEGEIDNCDDEWDLDYTIFEGDTVKLVYTFSDLTTYIVTEGGFLTIETRGVQPVDFSAAFIKLKVKDYFKEILIRNARIPFTDVENKRITFKSIDELLFQSPVADWSDKYVRRRSVKYSYKNYAQHNWLKHKYNDANESWADGDLVVHNENLESEKTLYQSFSYAPEQGLVEYVSSDGAFYVQNFRMFDVEVQVDENDDLIANYKQLKDRYYFIREKQVEANIYVLFNLATEFPVATYSENLADITQTHYQNMTQLINNAQILEVELLINVSDIARLDFFRRYYFEQEKAVFILNKLIYKGGGVSTAEFIKINS
jgi:hypothetical protein